MELPTDIITYILSFQDPNVTQYFKNAVLKQLSHLKKEFYYFRGVSTSRYFKMNENYVKYFILSRNLEKMHLNSVKINPEPQYFISSRQQYENDFRTMTRLLFVHR